MFKTVDINLPGFKYPKCKLKELNIADMLKAGRIQAEDDTKAFFFMVEKGLINDAGDRVINDSYTVEQFCEEMPQSVMIALGEAVAKLNNNSDGEALAIAKN